MQEMILLLWFSGLSGIPFCEYAQQQSYIERDGKKIQCQYCTNNATAVHIVNGKTIYALCDDHKQ